MDAEQRWRRRNPTIDRKRAQVMYACMFSLCMYKYVYVYYYVRYLCCVCFTAQCCETACMHYAVHVCYLYIRMFWPGFAICILVCVQLMNCIHFHLIVYEFRYQHHLFTRKLRTCLQMFANSSWKLTNSCLQNPNLKNEKSDICLSSNANPCWCTYMSDAYLLL